ncbi:MAG: hypothetical protein RIS54_2181 [Verrucomicrobiota bacterium]|jgi:hypothetical protein
MLRSVLSLVLVGLLTTAIGHAQPTPGLFGQIDDRTYIAPGGLYRVKIPVLPELGGTISDTANVVVFRDDYNVHVSIGAFALDATQRWELATRGPKSYLPAFFATYVMPDFERMFPGTHIESGVFQPGRLGGAVLCFTVLPGGSMFATQLPEIRRRSSMAIAKRGNLIFVQSNVAYVISIELTERVLEGSTYQKTPEEENAILRERLEAVVAGMDFGAPPNP